MRDAGDVLQRNALGALGDELVIAVRGGGVAQHQGPEPAEPDAEQVLGQEFGVDPGTRDAGGGQDGRGLADSVRKAQPGSFCHHCAGRDQSPMASRRACSSISMADWITGSRSPFMTWSRL